jgi:hypothetical protein
MPDGDERPQTFFFVHVMKTAGMTLNSYIDANFPPEQRYPTPGDPPMDYMVIKSLREAVVARRAQVRMWRGHFPFFVTALVPEATTLTLLREPVGRAISMLAQYRAQNAPDQDLEAVYDDEGVVERMLRNHQTKIFSLEEADGAGLYLHPLRVDEQRLATAKANLERVDLVGIQEDFDGFLGELRRRFGWRIEGVESVNIGEPVTITSTLRKRIEEDNALDLELYEHARGLLL